MGGGLGLIKIYGGGQKKFKNLTSDCKMSKDTRIFFLKKIKIFFKDVISSKKKIIYHNLMVWEGRL